MAGSDHVDVAVLLGSAGLRVSFLPDDAHDAARLARFCAHQGVDLVRDVTPGDYDMCLGTIADAWSLDWTHDNQDAVHLSVGDRGTVLLETNGDPRACASLTRALSGACLTFSPGHAPLTSRVFAAVGHAAERLLLTGSTPTEIDAALEAAGMPCGPFLHQDRVGLDTALAARRAVGARHGGPLELPVFARAVTEGRLGRKIGVGWYRYPGGEGPVEDPLVEDLAAEEAHFLNHARDEVAPEDCVAAIRDAVKALRADALKDGYAPQDLDLAVRHVLGSAWVG